MRDAERHFLALQRLICADVASWALTYASETACETAQQLGDLLSVDAPSTASDALCGLLED